MEEHYQRERISCPLCGADRHEIFLGNVKERYNDMDEWFDIVSCLNCGFIFTNPRPTPATIGYFYPNSAGYYAPKPERTTSWATGPGLKNRLLRAVAAREFGYSFTEQLPAALITLARPWLLNKLLISHLPRHAPSGRLLDIGCSWGGYLIRMRELGWEVHGVELNEEAARHAREQLGLDNVHTGFFDTLDYAGGFFDVIHMGMVLEHLFNPREALVTINGLLKNGGQLILSVPDISGLEVRLFRDRCYTLHVPQHLSHFTPQTLTRLLEETGFRVERIVHQKSKKDFLKSAEYMRESFLARLLLSFPVKKLLLGPLVTILAALGKTSRMSVRASKTADTASLSGGNRI
ncbi:MAG: class I SAM-dependent methyltransferase [Thermodesulfobacteriota bacterium]